MVIPNVIALIALYKVVKNEVMHEDLEKKIKRANKILAKKK